MAPGALPATLGPVLEFMRSLWALEHALSERAKDVRRQYGTTATERLVIRVLGQTPGTSAGEVARILHILPSTLTPVLQQLVARGLIERAADPRDRRRAVLWLTRRGERIDEASTSAVDDAVRMALSQLNPSEVFHARRVMNALAEALGQAHEAPTRRAKRSAGKQRRGVPVSKLPARRPRPAKEPTATAPRQKPPRQARG